MKAGNTLRLGIRNLGFININIYTFCLMNLISDKHSDFQDFKCSLNECIFLLLVHFTWIPFTKAYTRFTIESLENLFMYNINPEKPENPKLFEISSLLMQICHVVYATFNFNDLRENDIFPTSELISCRRPKWFVLKIENLTFSYLIS